MSTGGEGVAGRLEVSGFSLALAAVSLLVTLVMAGGIWDSLRPDPDAAGLAERKAYYEKVLRQADVSWHESRYSRAVGGAGAAGPAGAGARP